MWIAALCRQHALASAEPGPALRRSQRTSAGRLVIALPRQTCQSWYAAHRRRKPAPRARSTAPPLRRPRLPARRHSPFHSPAKAITMIAVRHRVDRIDRPAPRPGRPVARVLVACTLVSLALVATTARSCCSAKSTSKAALHERFRAGEFHALRRPSRACNQRAPVADPGCRRPRSPPPARRRAPRR